MELKRVVRAVASRWPIVAAIALLGVIAALVITEMNGRGTSSRFEATAAIAFEPEEGETVADIAEEIQAAGDFARIAATDLLQEDPDLLIVEDLAEARLDFIAQGPTREDAGAKAQALLQSFLETDPTLGEPVTDLIDQLEAEATEIREQIDALDTTLSPEEQTVVDQYDRIDQEIQLIESTLVGMVVDEAAANAEGRVQLASQRTYLQNRLEDLEAERAGLPEKPSAELSAGEQLLLTTLQFRMEQITSRYEQLYLRQLGVTTAGTVEPVSYTDLTPAPANPWLNAGLGLLGGLLIAVFSVMFLARTRRTVWLPEDVAVPVLGEIPPRRVGHHITDDWYDNAEPGPRKTSIQALRSAVEAHIPGTGTTIGITRHECSDDGARTLGTDLAASMATAGKSVLLIDADFGANTEIGTYRVGGTSLSSVLKLKPGDPEFQAEIQHAAESAYLVRPGLAVIPAGPSPASAADALAGNQFRALMAAAQERYDIVIVVVDEIGEPAARVPLQRLGYGIVAVTPGKTTMPELNGLLEDVHRLRITMLGAVFIGEQDGLRAYLSRGESGRSGRKRQPDTRDIGHSEDEPTASPISRLQNYPIPDERRSSAVPHSSLRDLTNQIERQPEPFVEPSEPGREAAGAGIETHDSTTSTDRPGELIGEPVDLMDQPTSRLGSELLEALSGSSEARAYAAVSEYLVTRTEDMVTARYGFGDFSEELIRHIAETGFVSMRPISEQRTAASWLKLEIEREADRRTAESIMKEMERVVSSGRDPAITIDDWLAEEFFRRHLTRTEGEPTVWHLASTQGTVGVLVPARRLNRARVESLISEVADAQIDEMVRYRDAASARGDVEQSDLFDLRVEDVRVFKSGLEQIVYGAEASPDRPETAFWIPDWSEGIRPNLAVFQAAGLLPFPVLGNEEMSAVPANV